MRARLAAGVAAIAALALGVRALPWREVIGGESVAFFGNDAWYHLRRITWSVRQFPEVLANDPYLNFPEGGKAIWSPAFDLGIAALARLAGFDAGNLDRIERAAVWLPPLFGVAAVLTTMLAARRFGRAVGWLCGLWLALLPAHFHYSQIGFVDHHAAVTWLAAASVAAVLALHDAESLGQTRRAWGWAALGGLVVAVGLLVWPGSLVSLGFLELGLAASLWACDRAEEASRRALRVAALHGVAAVCVAPLTWAERWPQWSASSPLVLSRFQPGWLLAIGAGAAACALLWRQPAFGATRGRRFAASIGVGAALALLSFAALPELGLGIREALEWLLRSDGFQARVAESQPLLLEGGAFSSRLATERFGFGLWVFPWALAWFLYSARRDPARWIVGCWVLGLCGVTLLQRRFFDTAAVGFVWVMAVATRAVWVQLPRSARPLLGVALVLLWLPTPLAYPRYLANEWRALRGEPLVAGARFGEARAGMEVADWLRDHTPPTRGWLDAEGPPEFGVLAPWHLGHVIVYRGRRPVAVSNFGDDLGSEPFAAAQQIFAGREPGAVAWLRARGLRYVVAEARAQDAPGRARRGSLLHALYVGDGAGLAHHRLVFESRGVAMGDARAAPVYKVFERVAGARVAGEAAPGALVRATLELRSQRGRRVRYRSQVRADVAGRYQLTLPHASETGSGGLVADSDYLLRCGSESARVSVGESEVRSGALVRGPDLCLTLTRAAPAADTGGS